MAENGQVRVKSAVKTSTGAMKEPDVKKKVAVVTLSDPPCKATADAMAATVLRPSVNAAAVIMEYSKSTLGEQDLGALVDALRTSSDAVAAGDTKRMEAMLCGQAHALQTMFMSFARRALTQQYQPQLEAFFRLALKAQNQCRMTLETLATIKNPPTVYARQANINNGGQQQVNNGSAVLPSAAEPDGHAADLNSPVYTVRGAGT